MNTSPLSTSPVPVMRTGPSPRDAWSWRKGAATWLFAAAWLVCGPAWSFVAGPYKDLNMGATALSPLASSAVLDGQPRAVAALPSWLPPEVNTLTLAFASGVCGQEHWGGIAADQVAQVNREALVAARLPYIIATGGEADTFVCESDAGFERMLQRWQSPYFVGVDFDVERQQTRADIEHLVARIKHAQQRHPTLRFSFTLATHAGSDGGGANLNDLGRQVMAAVARQGVKGVYFNLMVMNYGPAQSRYCVLRQPVAADGALCDMGASALQAARNFHEAHRVPMSHIELTPMIGRNDVTSNETTVQDMRVLVSGARAAGLGGVHFWSLDRDRMCPGGEQRVDPLCSGLQGAAAHEPLAFTRALGTRMKP